MVTAKDVIQSLITACSSIYEKRVKEPWLDTWDFAWKSEFDTGEDVATGHIQVDFDDATRQHIGREYVEVSVHRATSHRSLFEVRAEDGHKALVRASGAPMNADLSPTDNGAYMAMINSIVWKVEAARAKASSSRGKKA